VREPSEHFEAGSRGASRWAAVVAGLVICVEVAGAQETFTTLANVSVSTTTGDKPQSKLWFHGGRWWAVLPTTAVSPAGTWLWRLDDTRWTNLLRLSSSTSTRADTLAVGDVTHVLLYGSSPQLVSLEYVPSANGYAIWSIRPNATPVPLPGSETATIDMDTTGRLWLSTESGSSVLVYYSDYPYSTFSAPISLTTGIASDDITVVTALPAPDPPKVAVLWSNQNSQRFGFRVHVDGTDPLFWEADEVPASQSALHVGRGMADDHLHAAVASDGTLFASVKTSYDTSGFPQVALLVRRPDGRWDDLYQVDTAGTRPIVLLNEPADLVRVVYTAASGGGNIYFRDSLISAIGFGARRTLMTGSLNNATSTKMPWTDDVVIVASGRGVRIRRAVPGSTITTTSTTFTTTSSTMVLPSTTSTVVASTTTTTSTLAPGTTTTTTTSSTSTTVTAAPRAAIEADVSVVVGSSTAFGRSAAKLEVDNSPVKHTFIRFTVTGTGGHAVAGAVLRLHAASISGAESDSKGRAHASACGWNEATLTGSTSPQPPIGVVLDAPAGSVAQGQVVDFDVTRAITAGDGTYCVALDTLSSNGVDYVPREAGANGPAVLVTVAP